MKYKKANSFGWWQIFRRCRNIAPWENISKMFPKMTRAGAAASSLSKWRDCDQIAFLHERNANKIEESTS